MILCSSIYRLSDAGFFCKGFACIVVSKKEGLIIGDGELFGYEARAGVWPRFVRLVRLYRLRTGMSQRSFALLLGVSQAALARWETAAACPTPQHCRDIAGVCAAWTTDAPDRAAAIADTLADDLIRAAADYSLTYRRRAKARARLEGEAREAATA